MLLISLLALGFIGAIVQAQPPLPIGQLVNIKDPQGNVFDLAFGSPAELAPVQSLNHKPFEGAQADIVTVAGIVATGQYFSPVTTVSSSFAGAPNDGILGLAFLPSRTCTNCLFFNNAHEQGAVEKNQFGFFLGSSSSLYLGGTDTSKYSGSIEYHDVDQSQGFWQIPGAQATVGGVVAVSGFETVIDSGTTIMYCPPAAAKEVYAKVPGSTLFDSSNGFYSYPCDTPPEISFKWGGRDWAISADNVNLGTTTAGSSQCVGALAGHDLGLGDNIWLLSDRVMKSVYSVFDFDQNAVGTMAPPAISARTSGGTQTHPTASERAALGADRARIADIDLQILELEASVNALKKEKTTVQRRLDAYTYPVLTLPNEITSEIFVHFLPVYPKAPPPIGPLSPHLLCQICQKWRDIALATPALWRAISLPLREEKGLVHKLRLLEK
ncbi:aspartic peptidase domain-containing protein [Mycena polygramma]|nr:aspartic peptidase domain-containing protein [Mycena polygramma]